MKTEWPQILMIVCVLLNLLFTGAAIARSKTPLTMAALSLVMLLSHQGLLYAGGFWTY